MELRRRRCRASKRPNGSASSLSQVSEPSCSTQRTSGTLAMGIVSVPLWLRRGILTPWSNAINRLVQFVLCHPIGTMVLCSSGGMMPWRWPSHSILSSMFLGDSCNQRVHLPVNLTHTHTHLSKAFTCVGRHHINAGD